MGRVLFRQRVLRSYILICVRLCNILLCIAPNSILLSSLYDRNVLYSKGFTTRKVEKEIQRNLEES